MPSAEAKTPALGAPAPGVSSGVAPGDILASKYRVDQVLGSGGMGVVVAAEHIELREKVAIKFLLDEAADNAELSERFLREARAAVKIKSEHVVRVIDVGRLPSGAPYMVMEYLQGEDLSQRLERGPLPIEDAVDYIIQSCEAMNVAHHSGIVHRDLKPANLFLTQRPDGSPIIKVLDFGISKVSSPEAAELSLTHTQAMMGSPLYMSPEQMRSSKDVDRRTDIWSLGVILHELIAGDVPFSGSTFPEVLVKVMTEAPAPLRSLRAHVSVELEAVVRRCLEKAPAARYPSVAALAVALTPFASPRTLGLHGRLARSMSGPAPAPIAEAVAAPRVELGATRIEVGPMQPALPIAQPDVIATLPSATAAQAPREVVGTNTAWEESSEPRVPVRSLRWVGFALVGTVGLAAVVWALSRSPSAVSTPGAAAIAPAPVAAPAAVPAAAATPAAATSAATEPTSPAGGAAPATPSATAPTSATLAAAAATVKRPAGASPNAPAPVRARPDLRAAPAGHRATPAPKARMTPPNPAPALPAAKPTAPGPAPETRSKGRALSIDFK